MRRLAAGALLVACVMGAAPAGASPESQALSARGLIELNAGHTQQALELFDRAVAADPSDVDARYQRGAAREKLGDYSGAIDDLKTALAAQPNLTPAALELGVALSQSGHYAEAEPWLLRAQQQPDLDAQASLFLGIVQLRLDRLDDAERSFARARARDPSLDLAAEYYDGVIAYRRHDLAAAETHFTAVERASPESAMGRESVYFIDVLNRMRRAAYSAFGTVAFEYDSNVTLGPSVATPQTISGQGDESFVLNAGGTYVPWTLGPASLSLGYEFFQSLHFHLTDFNLQDHRPAVQLSFDFGRFVFGLLGRYDYYLLSTSDFLQEVTAFPWVAVREEGIGRTELYYRMQWRDYLQASFTQLNGYYNYFGARQIVDLGGPDREFWLGYQLGANNTTGNSVGAPTNLYQYGSLQLEVALRWPLPYDVVSEAGFRYEHQFYGPDSRCLMPSSTPECKAGPPPETGTNRTDNDYRAVVSFERPLSEIYEHLFVNASWYGTFNNSNKIDFQYDRQIGSIAAEVRF